MRTHLRRAWKWATTADSAVGLVERAVVLAVITGVPSSIVGLVVNEPGLFLGGSVLIAWVAMLLVVVWHRVPRDRSPRAAVVRRTPPAADTPKETGATTGHFGPADLHTEPTGNANVPVHYVGSRPFWIAGVHVDPTRTMYATSTRAADLIDTGIFAPGPSPTDSARARDQQRRRDSHEVSMAQYHHRLELHRLGDELLALSDEELDPANMSIWRDRVIAWVDDEIRLREVPPHGARLMRNLGVLPLNRWRDRLVEHLRTLGYYGGDW